MSRLTSDRNQQQPQQPNQQLVQNIQQTVRSQSVQQQPQFLTLAQSGSFLIINNSNNNSGDANTLRTTSNVNSSVQGSS